MSVNISIHVYDGDKWAATEYGDRHWLKYRRNGDETAADIFFDSAEQAAQLIEAATELHRRLLRAEAVGAPRDFGQQVIATSKLGERIASRARENGGR